MTIRFFHNLVFQISYLRFLICLVFITSDFSFAERSSV